MSIFICIDNLSRAGCSYLGDICELLLDTREVKSQSRRMATLGEKIKSLRSARQMSLRALELELAKHGGSAKFTAIGKWEQDAARPSRENLKAICEYFNVDPAWLMFGTLSAGDQLSTVMEDVKLLSPRSLRVLAKTIEALRDEDVRAEKTDITSSPQDTPDDWSSD